MIKLIRLDYRLLHGQVCFAWVQSLGTQRIIIVDDAVAADELKKSVLALAKPANVRLNFFSLKTMLQKMPRIEKLQENIMILFGNTKTLLGFCQEYRKIKEINYGGLSRKEDSKQYSEAIFMTPAELEDSRKLKAMGINLYMQQTPTYKKKPLNPMI